MVELDLTRGELDLLADLVERGIHALICDTDVITEEIQRCLRVEDAEARLVLEGILRLRLNLTDSAHVILSKIRSHISD